MARPPTRISLSMARPQDREARVSSPSRHESLPGPAPQSIPLAMAGARRLCRALLRRPAASSVRKRPAATGATSSGSRPAKSRSGTYKPGTRVGKSQDGRMTAGQVKKHRALVRERAAMCQADWEGCFFRVEIARERQAFAAADAESALVRRLAVMAARLAQVQAMARPQVDTRSVACGESREGVEFAARTIFELPW